MSISPKELTWQPVAGAQAISDAMESVTRHQCIPLGVAPLSTYGSSVPVVNFRLANLGPPRGWKAIQDLGLLKYTLYACLITSGGGKVSYESALWLLTL